MSEWQPIETHPMEDGSRFEVKLSNDSVWYAEFWEGPPGREKTWGGIAIDCTPGFYDGSIPKGRMTHWRPLPEPRANAASARMEEAQGDTESSPR